MPEQIETIKAATDVPIWVVVSTDSDQDQTFYDTVPAANSDRAMEFVREAVRPYAEVIDVFSREEFVTIAMRIHLETYEECVGGLSMVSQLVDDDGGPLDREDLAKFKRALLIAASEEDLDFTCPTCGDEHPPCTMCGGATRCPEDEVGEPFSMCDKCDAEMADTLGEPR